MPDSPAHLPPDPAASPEAEETALFDFYVEELETYLDGELDEAEAAHVRARLASAYAAALDRLDQQRRCRCDALGALLHPAAANDEECAAKLSKEANRLCCEAAARDEKVADAVVASRIGWDWWRVASLAAACLMLGFSLGIFGPFDLGTRPANGVSNPLVAGPNTGLTSFDEDRAREPADEEQIENR